MTKWLTSLALFALALSLGPTLLALGAQASDRESLSRALAEAATAQTLIRLTLTDGKTIEGTITQIEASQIVLKPIAGRPSLVQKSEIASVAVIPQRKRTVWLRVGAVAGVILLGRAVWNCFWVCGS